MKTKHVILFCVLLACFGFALRNFFDPKYAGQPFGPIELVSGLIILSLVLFGIVWGIWEVAERFVKWRRRKSN